LAPERLAARQGLKTESAECVGAGGYKNTKLMHPAAPWAETLEGALEHVTFFNPINGFSVVRLRVRGRREPVTVVGTLPAVQPGEHLVVGGSWQTDPRHGVQFRAERVQVEPPSALADMQRYLGSGMIRQIGQVLAERIVQRFGERTLDILDSQPERVREVPGIGEQRARAIAAAWTEHRALRAVTAFLGEYGLDTRYAPRLVARYGADAARVVAANPYRLVADVPGLGFDAADRLGQRLGVRPASVPRLQAAVQAALLRAAEQGHTRLGQQDLVARAASLAAVTSDLTEQAVVQLLASGSIAAADGGTASSKHGPLFDTTPPVAGAGAPNLARVSSRLRIYEPAAGSDASLQSTSAGELRLGLRALVRAEEALAGDLRRLANQRVGLQPADVDAWLGRAGESQALSEQQRAAVRTAATQGCFVLTGGPGVGKTTTLRVLVRLLVEMGRSVALAAPTGKAARRLGDVVGLEASTIHRLLGAGPRGFQHGPAQPVPADVVVVDEVSMLDTQLARALVAAIGPTSQLILVGDADQLPSVGPGQVLRDVLASGAVPAARLEQVFRQASQSQIVVNAHRIRQGQLPQLGGPRALLGESDCVFVPAGPERLAEVAMEWAAGYLPAALQCAPEEVQALAPLSRVCQVLNGQLQARLNPARADRGERPHGALPLRVGDRVIQTRNNYTLAVFNGETGTVASLDSASVTVDFGDGRLVEYAPVDLIDVDHAYCLTVHRAQGSEWPGVVVLVSSSFGPMLSRNLLYTALTRARRAAVLVGDEAGIARAVAEVRDQERQTGLVSLLKAERNHGVAGG
jgi:exodeoxyribonuclease V alpha subunit